MLDRKTKLATIRRQKQDEEEQRKLDVALKIAQQKADALKWQQERLLRQRQAKKQKKDVTQKKQQAEKEKKRNQVEIE